MAEKWQVVVHRRAEKTLKRMDKNLLGRFVTIIDALAENPYPDGVKKLVGFDDLYRVRVGDWRIVYSVQGNRLLILVLEISPRGGAYRDL